LTIYEQNLKIMVKVPFFYLA